MTRIAENDMVSWFSSSRRKPLVLRGARQVGKSTLVRNFAKSQGLILNEINLERYRMLGKIFKTLDVKRILEELSVIVGRNVDAPNTLLFLDEIQAVPEALVALRYFYEDRPDLAVVSAGSLLEFALDAKKLSMPVGRVTYLYLGPMNFREFLLAQEGELISYLDTLRETGQIPEMAHERLKTRLRQFMFVGGMPEAVLAYSEEGLSAVSEVQRMILESYEDDFGKYARGVDLALMQEVFRNLAAQSCKKVKYVNFSRETGSREVKAILNLFRKARVCADVRASTCAGLPLFAETEEGVWKELFLDVGLMNHACGIGWQMLMQMDDVRFVNEGTMAEQFVGQHLLYRAGGFAKPMLAYWLREGGKNNAEVDFVITDGADIVPVEVKSGAAGSLKSLRELVLAKGMKRAVRYDLNTPSCQTVRMKSESGEVSYELQSLPLYAV